ncbi:hypothetical protein BDZ89DRAFT_1037874 [Hymenopellis radicata]|nr:hypothetical protein BDZ89DRAFT_1037874 [Hymenopellis radicata]
MMRAFITVVVVLVVAGPGGTCRRWRVVLSMDGGGEPLYLVVMVGPHRGSKRSSSLVGEVGSLLKEVVVGRDVVVGVGKSSSSLLRRASIKKLSSFVQVVAVEAAVCVEVDAVGRNETVVEGQGKMIEHPRCANKIQPTRDGYVASVDLGRFPGQREQGSDVECEDGGKYDGLTAAGDGPECVP